MFINLVIVSENLILNILIEEQTKELAIEFLKECEKQRAVPLA